jgi:hypothetical protein
MDSSATVQAVSRWLPIGEVRVRARVWTCGICGGQRGARAGFLRALRFPLPVFIPPNSPTSQLPEAGTTDQYWPRSTKWTQSHLTMNNKIHFVESGGTFPG